MAIYSNNFDKIYSKLLDELEVTNYEVSKFTHIDQGYLSSLRNGHKNNPSPEILVKIGLALAHYGNKVKMKHIEELFNAAGRSLYKHRE